MWSSSQIDALFSCGLDDKSSQARYIWESCCDCISPAVCSLCWHNKVYGVSFACDRWKEWEKQSQSFIYQRILLHSCVYCWTKRKCTGFWRRIVNVLKCDGFTCCDSHLPAFSFEPEGGVWPCRSSRAHWPPWRRHTGREGKWIITKHNSAPTNFQHYFSAIQFWFLLLSSQGTQGPRGPPGIRGPPGEGLPGPKVYTFIVMMTQKKGINCGTKGGDDFTGQ